MSNENNENLYSQVYAQLVEAMRLNDTPFQLIGTPKSFAWATAPTGQMDPAAYQLISTMPQRSAVGNFSSQDATFFSAVKSIMGHVSFTLSPSQQQDQKKLVDDCTAKSNAMVKARSDLNQAYLSAQQNGGVTFAFSYPDVGAWITKAPEAAALNNAVNNAAAAYQRAIDLKLELEKAVMPSDLQDAIAAMVTPSGDPASTPAPAGWTKVPDGSGILRWQPVWSVDNNGRDWRAALTDGSAGAFALTLDSSDKSSDFKHSWASGKAGISTPFWGVSGGGGWDKTDIFNADSGVKISVKVESATRVAVTPGSWYPGGFLSQLAKAQQGPNGQGYTIIPPWEAQGGEGSSSLFGPYGLASARISELIVVYKPSFEITMSANTYQQNKQKFEASGGLRIGPFTFGGSGGHESEFTRSTAKLNTFSGQSTSDQPLIIGVVLSFPGTNQG